jgi:hypothetical protein
LRTAISASHPKETADVILCIDVSNPSDPKVRRLEIGQNTNNLTIVPTSIFDAIDLSIQAFDYAVAFRLLRDRCCKQFTNSVANSYDPFQKRLATNYKFFNWGYSLSITAQNP